MSEAPLNGLEIDYRGLQAGYARLKSLASDEEFPQLAWEVGSQILSEAQRRVPVDTAFLQNSDMIDPPVPRPGVMDFEIGFNADYAAAVHEVTKATHSQGEHHYLLNAIIQEGPRILGKQVDHTARRMGMK